MLQGQSNIQMQAIFDLIYPVGSLYFSTVLDTVEKVEAAFGGTWEKLPDGYAIWTASSGAGNTIAPGLPNITGTVEFGHGLYTGDLAASGAFSLSNYGSSDYTGAVKNPRQAPRISLNASRSSSIYGNSTTVQPPAYKTYVFKRLTLGGGLRLFLLALFLLFKGGIYVSK